MVDWRNKRSVACSEATSYRKVIGRIIDLAEGKLKEMYPNLTRTERICLAQEEPLFKACKELREPTEKELNEVKPNSSHD